MQTIQATYENGVFRPVQVVSLPDGCQVEFEPRVVSPPKAAQAQRLLEILSQSFDTDDPTLAALHNEHQP